MERNIWVIIESLNGEVQEISFTLLAAGRRLANAFGTRLQALCLSGEEVAFGGQLGVADEIVVMQDPTLAGFNPGSWNRSLKALFDAEPPRAVILGQTTIGSDLCGFLAEHLQLPVVSSCHQVLEGEAQAEYRSLFAGGKVYADGPLPSQGFVLSMIPGGVQAEEGKVEKEVPVRTFPVPAPDADAEKIRFLGFLEPEAGDVDIAKEEILVAVGRGIQQENNLVLANELAKALGGEVCASRPVVDQGWLPTTRLVGKSGKQVKPRLYLSLGISGAPEHLEGIQKPELFIAVNTDEGAPIFEAADYGASVDLLELMPRLTEKLLVPS